MTYKDVASVPAAIRGQTRIYTIAQKRSNGLFYIFDAEGGINTEQCFTSLARAEAYVPTMDHMVPFTAPVRKVGNVRS